MGVKMGKLLELLGSMRNEEDFSPADMNKVTIVRAKDGYLLLEVSGQELQGEDTVRTDIEAHMITAEGVDELQYDGSIYDLHEPEKEEDAMAQVAGLLSGMFGDSFAPMLEAVKQGDREKFGDLMSEFRQKKNSEDA